MIEHAMEHDTSKDFAPNIKKGDAAAVTFPLDDRNDGGILPGVRYLTLFPTEGKKFGEFVNKL